MYLGKNSMMNLNRKELVDHMFSLLKEIDFLSSRIEPHDCGHLHTTVGVLEDRIKELRDQIGTDIGK